MTKGIPFNGHLADISFYVKKNDLPKLTQNTATKPIPFFGLRSGNTPARGVSLWIDVWKFHYSGWVAFALLLVASVFAFWIEKLTFSPKKTAPTDKKLLLEKILFGLYVTSIAVFVMYIFVL